MKFKILLLTFSVSLAWLALLAVKHYAPTLPISRFFSSGVLIGLFIGSFLGRLFVNRKYLTDLTIENEIVTLTYLTSFAQQKQTSISLDSLIDIKVQKKLLLIRDFDLLRFSQKGNQSTFLIYNRSIRQTIERLIQSFSDRRLQTT